MNFEVGQKVTMRENDGFSTDLFPAFLHIDSIENEIITTNGNNFFNCNKFGLDGKSKAFKTFDDFTKNKFSCPDGAFIISPTTQEDEEVEEKTVLLYWFSEMKNRWGRLTLEELKQIYTIATNNNLISKLNNYDKEEE